METSRWKKKLYSDVISSVGLTATARQLELMIEHVWPFEIAECWLKRELTTKEADIETRKQSQAAQDAILDADIRNFEYERAIVDGPIDVSPDYVPDYDKNA